MSDWQTVRKVILEEVDRPNDTTYANRALVEALRFHRSDHYWFNEGYFDLLTTADTYRYKLPDDFVRQIGELYRSPSGSPTARYRLANRTVDFVTQYRHVGTDPDRWGSWEAGISSGPPSSYAYFNGELVLQPIPDTSSDIISGRYVRDLGIPSIKYDGTNWLLYEPWSQTTTLPATFTNAWLTEGQDLIRSRAVHILQQRYYRNPEAAQAALFENVETKNRLLVEGHRRRGPKSIRGSF